MKPNFALTLSFEGICLLHRAASGWDQVGELSLDSPDLSAELRKLRDRGLALSPDGLRSKLVLPNEQIRFLHFEAEDLRSDELDDAVRYHLEGKTPYALDELAHDWSISAGQVFVAAVARETLSEAETFAVRHGFDPVCFVAAPEPRDFVGEPWFGKTGHADTILPEDGLLERDTTAIRVTGKVPETVTTLPEMAVSSLERTTVNVPETVLPDITDPIIPSSAPDESPDPTATENSVDQSLPSETEEALPSGSDMDLAFTTRRTPRADGTAVEIPDHEAPDATPLSLDKTNADNGAAFDDGSAEAFGSAETEPPEAPPGGAAAGPIPVQHFSEETEPFDARPGSTSFAPETNGSPATTDTNPEPDAMRAVRTPRDAKRANFFGDSGQIEGRAERRLYGAIAAAAIVVLMVGVAAWTSVFDGNETAQDEADILQPLSSPQDTELTQSDTQAAGEQATARADAELSTPQDDRLQTPEPDTALPVAPEVNDDRQAALPDITVDEGSLRSREAPVTLPSPETSLQTPTGDQAAPAASLTTTLPSAPEPLTVPSSDAVLDFDQAAIDPGIEGQDAVALPESTGFATDPQPEPMVNPAPAGTLFDLDDRGLVRATTNGAITPDGITVFTGRPELVPPPRPADTLTDVALAVPNANVLGLTEEQFGRLVEIRPRSRPEDLREQTERAALGTGGRTQDELAAFRPNSRPQSAQELAAQEASLPSDITEEESANGPPFAGATAQAVSSSVIPRARPQGFDRVVASAVAAAEQRARAEAQRAAAQAASQQPSASANTSASPQPVLEPEDTRRTAAAAVPRNQRVSPRVPTASSVARAATEKNVLSLRRVNLIGVYGGPSDRRALVRLANGRYKKVQVGDRLDGGRVTAIGASELRYSKNGRDLALKMPKG